MLPLCAPLLGARVAAGRCGPAEAGWNREPLAAHRSPVDLRFLNEAPAGQRGFVRAQGERLIFEDGSEARFWGVNVQASALFRTDDTHIRLHARRIAELGFNLVRLHHHDSMRFVKPAVIDHRLPHSRSLNPWAMARLDLWISELKKQGVYVWLDLHTGRVFKRGDEIPGYEDLARGKNPGDGKGYLYLNPRLQALAQEFNAAFLGHLNPHTGLAYKEDPVVVGVLITNENDVTRHLGWVFRKSENLHHRALFATGLETFSARLGLSAAKILKTRIGSMLWWNQIEHDFNVNMRAHLREIGFRGVVATTNLWGSGRFHSLPSLADGDLIDVHAYGLPNGMRIDPRVQASFVAHIASGQLLGKPLAITEWSHGKPLADARYGSALFMAGIASLQGWDAPMLFGYSNRPLQRPGRPLPWSSFKDPPVMGLMPAAAVLFRQGHVQRARKLMVLEPGRSGIYREGRSAGKTPALRTLVEQSRVAIRLPEVSELPWSQAAPIPQGAVVVRDLDRSFLPPDGSAAPLTRVASDTGELSRDWALPRFTIDTPRSQLVSGALGGGPLALSTTTFEITTPEASVVLTSLDGLPLETSDRILLSALGRACPEPGKQAAYRSEPVVGTIRLRRQGAPLQIQPLFGSAKGVPEPLAGTESILVTLRPDAHWYLLTPR